MISNGIVNISTKLKHAINLSEFCMISLTASLIRGSKD